MNILNFKNINILSLALAFSLLVPSVQANEFGISDLEYQEIESRVNSMNFSEPTKAHVANAPDQGNVVATDKT